MVFMRHGRAENRHHAVAPGLADRSLVTVNGIHHAVQHRIQQVVCIFGVPSGEQLQGSLDVREQHGHLFALALQRHAGRQNPVGKMLRRIVPTLQHLDQGATLAQGVATFSAKFLAWPMGAATGGAGQWHGRAA